MKSFCEKLNILRKGFAFFIFLVGHFEVAFASVQEKSAWGEGLRVCL